MPHAPRRSLRRAVAALSGLAVASGAFATAPLTSASAAPGATGLVINEVYGGGGSTSTTAPPTYNVDFVELYNPTSAPVRLGGLHLQYRSGGYTGSGTVNTLSLDAGDQVPPGEHYLVSVSDPVTNGTGAPLTDVDQDGSGLNMAAGGGQVLLTTTSTPVTATGNLAGVKDVVDAVGYGTSTTTSYEGSAPTGQALSTTTSTQRVVGGSPERPGFDTDTNATDFAAPGSPTPTRSATDTTAPPLPPREATIAEIQGTGSSTPLSGTVVRTTGVVTAAYPSGGYNGFVIQTGGTGGALGSRTASDAVFVWGGDAGFASYPAVGDSVEVVGTATEFQGLTQVVPGSAGSVTPLPTPLPAVVPTTFAAWPSTETARESLESMLVQPTSAAPLTVTNVFTANSFGEIGVAAGTTPLVQPTETIPARTGNPPSNNPAIATATAANENRRLALDDGASVNYLNAQKNTPLPYLSTPGVNGAAPTPNPIRVGSRVTVTAPVVMDWRNSTWKLQPRTRITGRDAAPATFTNTRTANNVPRAVGGDLQLATFNVLNYFPTTGLDWIDAGADCSADLDRQSNPVTVDECTPAGPRGAWDDEDLERQEVKIVNGLIATGAEVVGLQEIENSAKFGQDRDAAVATLVAALNERAGAGTWAFVPTPPASDLPPVADQDVIRNAIIYKPAAVTPVGASASLGVDSRFVGSAREPMAQVFRPRGGDEASEFTMIVNHFKSKGSGVDDGTQQGNANPARVAQAEGLAEFAEEFAEERGVEATFLVGDFNSYTAEDPMQVLYGEQYRKIGSDTAGEYSYSFSGLSGSLDHVLASPAAARLVTGADYWSINGGESQAFEYSRFNYNATQFYDTSVFRSSDHDPMVVGIELPESDPVVDLDILSVNDFHGRINNATTSRTGPNGSESYPAGTAQFAGTIETIRENSAAGRDNVLLLGNGDLYGASEFNSAINEDVPTFDVMNALDLAGSSVGNHEFDFGFRDLTQRVLGDDNETGEPLVDYPYLGANVYAEGTTDPVLPEYALYDVNGVTVAAVGVVTQETPSLVSPAGIEDLEFGNAAEAADRVATQLSDGDEANGEADVVVVLAHAGGQGFAEGATFEQALAATTPDSEFQQLTRLGDDVDAIFNGHTHQVYALRQTEVGNGGRAIVQAGQYGEHVGRVTLSFDRTTGEVTTRRAAVRDRVETPTATLVDRFEVVRQVQAIVDRAIADAAVVGNVQVGRVAADVTRSRTSAGLENRADESTIGGLVGNALRDGVPESAGSPDLGLVNPGGLRGDLLRAPSGPETEAGVVRYSEANTVLPFTNNVSLVELTGAQLTAVLEQQWQPAGADRPYLQLGLSDNVQVTSDPTAPVGSRISSVRIDGAALDPEATYVVSTFSFLAAGGDNFTAFRQGRASDTGLLDRDVWISYLQDTSLREGSQPISPDFARRHVDEVGLPASLTPGQTATFSLRRLNMTSGGSPSNTVVTATLVSGDTARDLGQVGTVTPANGGAAEVTVTVPDDAPAGSVVELVAAPNGTTVTVPVGFTTTPPTDPQPPVDPPTDPEPTDPDPTDPDPTDPDPTDPDPTDPDPTDPDPTDPDPSVAPQATVTTWANPQPARPGQTVRINARVTARQDGEALPVAGRVFVRRGNGEAIGSAVVDEDGRIQLRRSFARPGTVFLVLSFRSADRSTVRDGRGTLRVLVRR